MIKTITVDSIDEVMKIISEQTFNDSIGRLRSKYYYRGLPDASFSLSTSLRVNCKNLSEQLEKSVLKAFTKYASIDEPSIVDSVWKQMIIGQHHGLPTRLMDWTYSPLIAIHFANTESNLDNLNNRDCVVWRIDINDCNKNLPKKYLDVLEKENKSVFSLTTLTSLADSIEKYDSDMKDNALVMLEPPSIDQRIVNQYSFFSIIPSKMTDIEGFLEKYTDNTVKFIIKKELRWVVRDLLDQCNINERIFYPGLDGLSKTLARHYFVK